MSDQQRRALSKARFVAPLALLALARQAAAGEAASPAEATVFIRVTRELRAEPTVTWKPLDPHEREIVTGSGFLVSPSGHVLTSHHVVSDQELSAKLGGRDVQTRLEVKQIEVVLPSGAGGYGPRRLVATVEAVDPDLDLALLSVPATDLPFLPLGDSDALEAGQAVSAWGFPFGRQVEVGKPAAPDVLPEVSVSRGSVAAVRADEEGLPRYIQTDATLNPGNSGGPLADEEGYVVGVVRMILSRGRGIGFAVPINSVKDFLESRGLEALLPSRRLRLGAAQSFPWKGLRLRVPEGFDDVSPSRLRWDAADADETLRLTIDRVASPWSLRRLESLLLAGDTFGPFHAVRSRTSPASTADGHEALVGSARGRGSAGEQAIEYALVDLGKEKIVARYVGPPREMAFNRGVLRGSLKSLEADRLLTSEVSAPLKEAFDRMPIPDPAGPTILLPARWARQPAMDAPRAGLPAPDSGLSASPEGDFTVTFRALWRRSLRTPAEEAAAAFPSGRGTLGPASYVSSAERFGVRYWIEGVFLKTGEDLLQLEVQAPHAKRAFVRSLFLRWVEDSAAPPPEGP